MVSKEDRKKALELYKKGELSCSEISRRFGKTRTWMDWLVRQEGVYDPNRKPKLTSASQSKKLRGKVTWKMSRKQLWVQDQIRNMLVIGEMRPYRDLWMTHNAALIGAPKMKEK